MKILLLSLLILVAVPSLFAQSATVTWTTTYQTMDGWGASTGYNEHNPNLTAAQADCFFSVTNGSCASGNSIGLEWVRIQDNQDPVSAPDLPTLQLAVARGAKIKLGFNGPQLNSSSFASQSSYMVSKIQFFQTNGVPISAIGVLNEPTNTGTTAANLDTYIATVFGPALTTAGLSIPLVLGEHPQWFAADYVTPCMNDASCSQYVPIVAGHGYGFASPATDGFPQPPGFLCCTTYANVSVPSSASTKRVWQTEVYGGFNGPCASNPGTPSYDPSMADALVWAHNIYDFLTVANGSAWMYWNLQAQTVHGPPNCNDGLTDSSGNPAKRFYAVGNWSRFVRPGWVRIDATDSPAPGIYITAFKETSSGKFAIVAINQNSSPANVNFSLSGFPSVTSVTPAVTSASADLIDQANANVSSDAFAYSLPATSVVTFHGTASSSSSKAPAPPTNLVVSVH
jgi:glucuronoarabinoxylan endo-1,4-beta-xylanase